MAPQSAPSPKSGRSCRPSRHDMTLTVAEETFEKVVPGATLLVLVTVATKLSEVGLVEDGACVVSVTLVDRITVEVEDGDDVVEDDDKRNVDVNVDVPGGCVKVVVIVLTVKDVDVAVLDVDVAELELVVLDALVVVVVPVPLVVCVLDTELVLVSVVPLLEVLDAVVVEEGVVDSVTEADVTATDDLRGGCV
ncbi:hypothetical protein EW145_g2570 [Phellinidium pouzarii]|uniref:Uncharacterized protein n=1 Tax=Phellinidium pouzarii TaxID=167371 RepID=A0A4S4LAB6_9AGAM|nr:hypothetical protein EW145_g2570 [Phellinidium pouzarii]